MHGYRKSSEVELVRRKRQRINKNTTKCCVTFCCKKKKKIAKHFRLKDLDQKSTRNQQRRVKTSSLASWSKWKKKSQILFRLLLQFLIEFPWNLEAREFFSPTNWQSSNLWFDRSNPSFFFSPLPSSPLFLHGRRKKGGEPIEGGSDGNKACLDKTIVRLDYPAGDTRMSLSSSGSRPYVEENSRFEPRLGRIMVEVGSEDTRPVHRPVLDLW